MKKKLLFLAFILSACASIPAARAQDVNVSMQPEWGPTGYDYVNYYYLPDVEAYYSVPLQQFTYFNGYRWVSSPDLPPRYANFDLYGAYKVVLNEPSPWYHHNLYRNRYYHFRGMHNEGMIRESHDRRYFDGRRDGFHHDDFHHDAARHDDAHRNGFLGKTLGGKKALGGKKLPGKKG